jgi:hypothetical protein
MIEGYGKQDPATIKKLPVQSDVPELLVTMAYHGGGTEKDKAAADLTMIAFYYLLSVGEYTVKGSRNSSKQTVQFKFEDVTFFRKNNRGILKCLPRTAHDSLLATADGATLKLDNQKNGWKGVCVYHETNGESEHCPVRALGRRYLHLRQHGLTKQTFLSTYFDEANIRNDINNEDITAALKRAARVLNYPLTRGIPIDRIDTHSLRSGGANALSLAGFSDTQIQKMGRWRGATFKEYVREELASFSESMSTKMKQKFQFVNVAGNAMYDITDDTINSDYTVNASAGAA